MSAKKMPQSLFDRLANSDAALRILGVLAGCVNCGEACAKDKLFCEKCQSQRDRWRKNEVHE